MYLAFIDIKSISIGSFENLARTILCLFLTSFFSSVSTSGQAISLLDSSKFVSVGFSGLFSDTRHYQYDLSGREVSTKSARGYRTKTDYFPDKTQVKYFYDNEQTGFENTYFNLNGFIVKVEGSRFTNHATINESTKIFERNKLDLVLRETTYDGIGASMILTKDKQLSYNEYNLLSDTETIYYRQDGTFSKYNKAYSYDTEGKLLGTSRTKIVANGEEQIVDSVFYTYHNNQLQTEFTKDFNKDTLAECTLVKYKNNGIEYQETKYYSENCVDFDQRWRKERILSESPFIEYASYSHYSYSEDTKTEKLTAQTITDYYDFDEKPELYQIHTRSKIISNNSNVAALSSQKDYYRLYKLPELSYSDDYILRIFPNPIVIGSLVNVFTDHPNFDAYALISDTGQLIEKSPVFKHNFTFNSPEIAGTYNLVLLKNNKLMSLAKTFIVLGR